MSEQPSQHQDEETRADEQVEKAGSPTPADPTSEKDAEAAE
ncbi:MAG TPA: hypothetical protein VHG90_02140 [Acidimicrobiales bacterium]|nr:hypothetical protein [Acidimicrobiales bacterium]